MVIYPSEAYISIAFVMSFINITLHSPSSTTALINGEMVLNYSALEYPATLKFIGDIA